MVTSKLDPAKVNRFFYRLALVSHEWEEVSRAYLHAEITLEKEQQANSLVQTLNLHPDRAPLVKKLELGYDVFGADEAWRKTVVIFVLSRCLNLGELRLCGEEGEWSNAYDAVLAKSSLHTLKLRWTSFTAISATFPSLRALSLTAVTLPHDIDSFSRSFPNLAELSIGLGADVLLESEAKEPSSLHFVVAMAPQLVTLRLDNSMTGVPLSLIQRLITIGIHLQRLDSSIILDYELPSPRLPAHFDPADLPPLELRFIFDSWEPDHMLLTNPLPPRERLPSASSPGAPYNSSALLLLAVRRLSLFPSFSSLEMPKQHQQQQPKRNYQEVAHDRVLCAAVHFTSANPDGLNQFGAIGGLAVAAILGRYEFRPRAALIPVARAGAQDLNDLVWERLTKISHRRAQAPKPSRSQLTSLHLHDLDIDVDIEAHYTLDVIVDNLQAKGQGPSFIPAGKLLSSTSKTDFSGSFYRKGKANPKGPKVEDKTVFWWGKRAPEGANGDVKIDMHKGTKMQNFMPAHANPFRATKLFTVHLRPKIPIGQVRIFAPPLILLSKICMARQTRTGGIEKLSRDFLDIERLLVAERGRLPMGLDAKNMKGWIDNMPLEMFKKLEEKVKGWRTGNSQALSLNDWEFRQLKFADSVSEEEEKEIKSKNLDHWIHILTTKQILIDESHLSKVHSLAKFPFHVYSRHDQAERLAALAESDYSVPTLRRSKRVKVFKSSI
ncbi:hypothetical protein BCR35DRAFT_337802 [Leucosporidium creatinivorum]|uniref:Uncharacterized protein n=1 Tax=Leucosporidium creatinivorum TaxID=106004 RepID=A0A1Y2FY21_9BASI|nr:hypothetical protein BCR35DRAFT_337802 [Leucosporidium creatinivorum]